MNDSLKDKLTKLHLPGIIQTTDMRAEQAIKERLDYREFLELLINDELMNRSRNRRDTLVKRSRIPQYKTIEEFNFSWQPTLNKQVIYSLGTCEFIRKKENIAFIGLPGTGKTHLSIALGLKAIDQGYTVLFTTLSEMMEDLYISRADNSFRQKLKKYTTPDLLIIDEFGLKKLSQTNVDDLYEVISKRYEKSSTIITSNKQFDEWGGILYDPVLATAILDRFVHHCSFIVIEGESYRMKERERITRVNKRGRPKKNKEQPAKEAAEEVVSE
ncbi:MAG: IS21-like element helper ATPase IstB [Lachnospiraceae bacterium]|nr:IS21-like element helper ATPase IstB [Lachnospiraceae bacterium]